MARAVAVFKENAQTADRLAVEQREEQARKGQRQAAMEADIKEFYHKITRSLATLGTASGELQATAQSMSATVERATVKSSAVAQASEDASATASAAQLFWPPPDKFPTPGPSSPSPHRPIRRM